MRSITTTLERDGDDIEVEVVYRFSPRVLGAREYRGAQLEPDTEATVEIERAVDANGNEIDLDDEEIERCEALAWEDINDND